MAAATSVIKLHKQRKKREGMKKGSQPDRQTDWQTGGRSIALFICFYTDTLLCYGICFVDNIGKKNTENQSARYL